MTSLYRTNLPCILPLVLTLAACFYLPCAPAAETPAVTDGPESFFARKVLPILSQRCWECHGDEVQESGLRLDSREDLLAGGNSGEPIAVVGMPGQSHLIANVEHRDGMEMPPGEQLSEEEIDVLRTWISTGLTWPRRLGDEQPLTRSETKAALSEQHWSFQRLAAPPKPDVLRRKWIRQPLDQFILGHLENAGLAPSPPADRYTLIRRLKFDLHGLPPTIEEVTAFVNDTNIDAYERLVDRYLESPHYGERWGRHWLDVARYADTKGYAFNRDRRYPFAYTYRDYVIESLNRDVPIDQFIRDQLAADLIYDDPHDPRLAALGFLTVGRRYNNRHLDIDDQIDVVGRGLLGLTVACARCHDHKYDPIPTDDYYSLYGVFASISEPDELPILGDPTETPGYAEYQKELERLQTEVNAYLDQTGDKIVEQARQHAGDYLARAITTVPEKVLQQQSFISLKGEQVRNRLVQHWRKVLATTARADHPVLGPLFSLALLPDNTFTEKAKPILDRWRAVPAGTNPEQLNPYIHDALKQHPPETKLAAAELYGQVFSAAYARYSNTTSDNSSIAPPDGGGADTDEAKAMIDPGTQQLLDLLMGPSSLTEFGRDDIVGMLTRDERNKHREREKKVEVFQVESPGSPPRAMVVQDNGTPHQPRIFIRGNHGRPGKNVPRQFLEVLSGPERQPFSKGSGRLELAEAIACASNPLTARVLVNRVWMHHFSRPLVDTPSDFGTRSERPLQADTLDFLADEFVRNGWSLKTLHRQIVLSNTYRQASMHRPDAEMADPENRLYCRMNRRRLEFEAMRDALLAVAGQLELTRGGRPVNLTGEPYSMRRAVYGYIDRQDLPGLFRVFDLASPDQSCPKRSRTTVPQQALFFLNSTFVADRASRIAEASQAAIGDDPVRRIQWMYRTILAREPTAEETEIGADFVGAAMPPMGGSHENTSATWQQYAQLLLMSNEFVFID